MHITDLSDFFDLPAALILCLLGRGLDGPFNVKVTCFVGERQEGAETVLTFAITVTDSEQTRGCVIPTRWKVCRLAFRRAIRVLDESSNEGAPIFIEKYE